MIAVPALPSPTDRQALVRRVAPRLLDAGLVLLCVVPALGWAVAATTTVGAVVAVAGGLAAGALVLWRRRRPEAALAALVAVVLATGPAAIGYPALLVAVVAVSARRPWRDGALAAAAAAAALLVHRVAWEQPLPPGTFVTALATAAAALLAGLYLQARSAYDDELAERALADERVRIARELHDVVAHNVSLMVVQAQALGVIAAPGDPVADAAGRIAGLGREAMAEMHRTLMLLRDGDAPAERAPQPGLERLGELLDRARAAGVDVTLRREGEPRPLAPGVDLSAYRILQEALTNVLRHAHGAPAEVTVRYRPDAVELVIADAGPGAGAPDRAGHGIVGMRERTELFGGSLRAVTAAGGGFRVEAVLPDAGAGAG